MARKIALVHDFLVKLGGAERVLASLCDLFPDSPVYTLLYDAERVGTVFPPSRVRVSGLSRFPAFLRRRHRYLLPFFPRVTEQFDFSDFDLVISSSNSFVHGVLTPLRTKHICYCHSPMRFAWDWYHEYLREQRVGFVRRAAVSHLMKNIRIWDQTAKDRPDLYIANSVNVQKRIKKYYRTDSEVVYPPVDIDRFKVSGSHEDYFLLVSALTPYKKIDLAIHLFNKIRKHLIIVGDGAQRSYLESISGPTIEFTGYKPDAVVTEYLQNCCAFIFPGEEDFGIAPVEAMACGKPVLGYSKGGLLETIIPGVTGEFFDEPNILSMELAFSRLVSRLSAYDGEKIRAASEKFSRRRFETEIRKMVNG